jgi:DnaK suppressor protein
MDDMIDKLKDKRSKLEAELARMTAPPRESTGISFGKRVGDGTSMAVDRLVDVAAHDQLQSVLADVERALAKVADESYGRCDRCGRDIGPERLEILPWAVLCVTCAARR